MSSRIKLLITGGAGFIGSNLVEKFLNDSRIELVRVLDDLSNGYYDNIAEFENHPKFEFIKGDIRNYETCLEACNGINKITHQAALGSVPRSISDPMTSTAVNILGTVNIMHAAVQQRVERIVLAFSSSTYGDHEKLPKVEEVIGQPLSPYAVTKLSIEYFAKVFGEVYNLNWVGLRYFNVFGPKQNPNNPYAAVIPIFCNAALKNESLIINGDGKTSRDFTYIENVLSMNDLALFTENSEALNQIYNCACGENISLLEMTKLISELTQKKLKISHRAERPGDVKHSLADISKAKRLLNYDPKVLFKEGLKKAIKYYENER
jgi:UDP-N-acetylglucosamine 4-epimerase